jgi:anti-sigma regulatory factor (Ser/Thr protein kinase)
MSLRGVKPGCTGHVTLVPLETPDVLEETLGHDARAAGQARRTTRSWLAGCPLDDRVEDLVLVVSELVSNALLHGKPPVTLMLRKVRHGVELEVHDHEPAVPTVGGAPVALEAEGGRGLAIALALADTLEVVPVDGNGKIVRACFHEQQQ